MHGDVLEMVVLGVLLLFSGTLTRPRLVEIYKKNLLPSSSLLFEENWFLQEDNDPKHRSRLAKNWRELNNVNRIDFPSYSPDLNPIENLWRVMKYKVSKFYPQTKAQLINSIHLVRKTFSKKNCPEFDK